MSEGRRVPRLMLVTDRRRSDRPLPDLVRAAVAGGVDAVQLRDHDLSADELKVLAIELRDLIAGRATLLINGSPSLAADLGLGLHLPEAGVATAEARRQIGPAVLLGRSVHSAAAATAAAGGDYLLAGHVYPTPSKPDAPPLGLGGLRRIVEATWTPVLAIGGITAANAVDVLRTGAQGIAVIGAIAEADDPRRAAAELRSAVEAILGPAPSTEEGTMRITVNGKEIDVESDTTVADYLAERGFQDQLVAVELNGSILARRAFDSTFLSEGDRLEIVHFVGGG